MAVTTNFNINFLRKPNPGDILADGKIIKTGKLEDMSEQELEAKMKQILDDYAQIIDVTPSTTSESSLPKPEES